MRVHLLLVAQFQWLKLALKAELNQLEDLVIVLFNSLHKVLWYDLLNIVFLLHPDAVLGAFLHQSDKFISFLRCYLFPVRLQSLGHALHFADVVVEGEEFGYFLHGRIILDS